VIDHDLNDFIEKLLEKHYAAIVRCAYMRLGNIHDAEDAAQDVFVSLMTAKKRPLTEEHAKAWLIRSVINRSVDIIRSRKYRDTLELNEEIDEAYTSIDGGLDSTVTIDAVMMLPPKQREAVFLYYYEDMSIAEIAKATGRNAVTVGSDLRRARKKLSEILTEEI